MITARNQSICQTGPVRHKQRQNAGVSYVEGRTPASFSQMLTHFPWRCSSSVSAFKRVMNISPQPYSRQIGRFEASCAAFHRSISQESREKS